MPTKNLVPRSDSEGKLGLITRRWLEINAATARLNTVKVDTLNNLANNELLIAGDGITINQIDEGSGNQYKISSNGGGGGGLEDQIFATNSDGIKSSVLVTNSLNPDESKISFTIRNQEKWRIDQDGNYIPMRQGLNLGLSDHRVNEIYLSDENSIRFASSALNISNNKLQFGLDVNNSFVYDNIPTAKESVKYASTDALDVVNDFVYENNDTLIATNLGPLREIDGFSDWSEGDRILIKDQSDRTQNGIYEVAVVGDGQTLAKLVRSTDLALSSDFENIRVSVLGGNSNAGKIFFTIPHANQNNEPESIVGANNLSWLEFSGSLDEEAVQDVVGQMINTQTGISITYDDNAGKLNFVVDSTPSIIDATGIQDGQVLVWDDTAAQFVPADDSQVTDSHIVSVTAGALQDTDSVTWTYDANLDTITPALTLATTDLTNGTNIVFDNANATFANGTNYNYTNSTVQVATPTAGDHAATKAYVDNFAQGINSVLQEVRLATTSPINIATDLTTDDSLQGKQLVAGDRILVKDQQSAIENGIYEVQPATAAAIRAADFSNGTEVSAYFVFVEEGNFASTGFICTSPSTADTVGTHDIEFQKFSGAGQFEAGDALEKVGTAFNVLVDNSTITINNDNKLQVATLNASVLTDGTIPADRFGAGTIPISALQGPIEASSVDEAAINPLGLTGIDSIKDGDTFIVRDVSVNTGNPDPNDDGQTKKTTALQIKNYIREDIKAFGGQVSFEELPDTTITTSLNISNFIDLQSIADEDHIIISDTDGGSNFKKITFAALKTAANTLDINGLNQAANADITLNDFLPMYDNTGNDNASNKKITISQLKNAISDNLNYVKVTDVGNVNIEPNTHYHIVFGDTTSGTFIFDLTNTNHAVGDIIKISMTNFNFVSNIPWETSYHFNETRMPVEVRLNSGTLTLNQYDFTTPVEFVYTEGTTSGQNPAQFAGYCSSILPAQQNPIYDIITSANTLDALLANQLNFARFPSYYTSINSSEFSFEIPPASVAATEWGYKIGDKRTIYLANSANKKVTIYCKDTTGNYYFQIVKSSNISNTNTWQSGESGEAELIGIIAGGGSISDFNLDQDIHNLTCGRVLEFDEDSNIKKITLTLVNGPGGGSKSPVWLIEQNHESTGPDVEIPSALTNGEYGKVLQFNSDNALIQSKINEVNINDFQVSKQKMSKMSRSRKVLGHLNPLAENSETASQAVEEINVLDDLTLSISGPTNTDPPGLGLTEHSNLVTAQAVKNYINAVLTEYAKVNSQNAVETEVLAPSNYTYINFTHEDPVGTIYTIANDDFIKNDLGSSTAKVVVKSNFPAQIASATDNSITFHNLGSLSSNSSILGTWIDTAWIGSSSRSAYRDSRIPFAKLITNNIELPLFSENEGNYIDFFLVSSVNYEQLLQDIQGSGVQVLGNPDRLEVPAFPTLVPNRLDTLDPSAYYFGNGDRYTGYTFYLFEDDSSANNLNTSSGYNYDYFKQSGVNTNPQDELIQGYGFNLTSPTETAIVDYRNPQVCRAYQHTQFNADIFRNTNFDTNLNNVTCKGFSKQDAAFTTLNNTHMSRLLQYDSSIEKTAVNKLCVYTQLYANPNTKRWEIQKINRNYYLKIIEIPEGVSLV